MIRFQTMLRQIDCGIKPSWEAEPSLEGLFKTIKEVLFSPSDFFRLMPKGGGIGLPLLFGVINNTLGVFLVSFWGLLLGIKIGLPEPSASWTVLYAILLPVISVVDVFFSSSILHLCLLIVGGGKAGFEATFRVVSYSRASYLWAVLPVLGPFMSSVYMVILYIIGLKEAHAIGNGKAILAVFLPILILAAAFLFIMITLVSLPQKPVDSLAL
ncbi:MAG: hypothetical protein DRG31_04185 [Deltaproteobacteria bacterium]|nr:MAG: hypothetical protein DRG31_04185 [Deltaproteobacteria bacterium]